jgi:hypothetical protein
MVTNTAWNDAHASRRARSNVSGPDEMSPAGAGEIVFKGRAVFVFLTDLVGVVAARAHLSPCHRDCAV